ncbi:ABC transporter ATP-binding protein [Bacillus carboniphilus]|uniref:ABC transporter ATP-binding protein n=1 Tax=Bacillus carboniphilus TaxID=86663 RepID=A0ABN0WNF6_9BACI
MIQVNQLNKSFGNKEVLRDISFSVGEGRIIGLFGTNGAGKSTLLKVIAGLLRIDHGSITFHSHPSSIEKRSLIAYLGEQDTWYPWMKLSDAMDYMKDMYRDWDHEKAQYLLNFFQLDKNERIREVSKGTLCKMNLLLTLSRRAKYVLLDEPFSGIDPFTRREISKAIVDDFVDEGQTIIVATQEIEEVEMLLDEILFLDQGQLLLHEQAEELRRTNKQGLLGILEEVYAHARM